MHNHSFHLAQKILPVIALLNKDSKENEQLIKMYIEKAHIKNVLALFTARRGVFLPLVNNPAALDSFFTRIEKTCRNPLALSQISASGLRDFINVLNSHNDIDDSFKQKVRERLLKCIFPSESTDAPDKGTPETGTR